MTHTPTVASPLVTTLVSVHCLTLFDSLSWTILHSTTPFPRLHPLLRKLFPPPRATTVAMASTAGSKKKSFLPSIASRRWLQNALVEERAGEKAGMPPPLFLGLFQKDAYNSGYKVPNLSGFGAGPLRRADRVGLLRYSESIDDMASRLLDSSMDELPSWTPASGQVCFRPTPHSAGLTLTWPP